MAGTVFHPFLEVFLTVLTILDPPISDPPENRTPRKPDPPESGNPGKVEKSGKRVKKPTR